MLTRKQFVIMLLLAILGTIFAWYLQKFINWSGALDWVIKVQLYEFLAAVAIVLGFILVAWINARITQKFIDQQQKDLEEEERKFRVAEKVRARETTEV